MVDRTQVQEKIHCVRYPKSYGLYVWVWRMLVVLVKGERRGGGLLCVLLVQLPSLAHGCRRMEGLEVLISWEQVSQRL